MTRPDDGGYEDDWADDERVRLSDLAAAQGLGRVRAWDEVDYVPDDETAGRTTGDPL